MRYGVMLVVLFLTAIQPAAAATQCTQETLHVNGTPVTLAYCVNGSVRSTGGEVIVPVAASFAAPGGSFSRTRELHFVDGERTSRVIEDLELSRLGLTGTLHLTLAYSSGLVHVEGALLTPGAITIK